MKLELEKAGVILGFIGVSWVSRGTLTYAKAVKEQYRLKRIKHGMAFTKISFIILL